MTIDSRDRARCDTDHTRSPSPSHSRWGASRPRGSRLAGLRETLPTLKMRHRALDAGCFVSTRSVLARAPGSPAPGPAVIRDAAFDRDPGGQLKEFRREWQVSARRMPCDSMPIQASDSH